LLARAEQGLFDVSVQLQGYRPNSSGTRTKGKGDRPGKLEESEISYYYRSLWQTAKHAKVDWVGELPSPEPVPLTAEQVLRGAKAAIISAVPPLMVKTPANPLGLAKSVFDDLQAELLANRVKFYYDLPAGPFYGFNRPGVKTIEPNVWNWWRQGMMGGAKAHYDGIVAFSQTDFTEDLKKISVPVLVMHSEDDQIVPYQAAGPLSAKLLKNGTLKTYKDYPHGMITTQADVINADLLAFIKS
jgi:pimeloyl-ACP methyl ester carboxylesterase